MAVVDIIAPVRIYNYGLDSNAPMTGVPGTNGHSSAQFITDISVYICVMDDGTTYLAPNGGTVSRNLNDLTHISGWTSWPLTLYGCDKPFSAYATAGGVSLSDPSAKTFYTGELALTGANGSSNANCTVTSVSPPAKGSSYIPEGFVQVNPVSQWQRSENGDTIYYYALGYVYNGGSVTTEAIAMNSVQFSITVQDVPELFEYYPWQRMIDREWYSLNRNGGKATTAGLFRKINGAWTPMTNIQGGSNSHGFVYNNGWQISPKSGKGA